jgi:hypothetical protein
MEESWEVLLGSAIICDDVGLGEQSLEEWDEGLSSSQLRSL